jgi:hypothetical protein
MKPTKKQLKEIAEVEKKVAEVCDANDSILDEITGIPYPKKTTETPRNDNNITLREFLAICISDIDIFLLKDESQENDNDKLYTAEEIRNQLKSTMIKMTSFTFVHPDLYDVDLFSALSYKVLRNSGFSEKYINSLQINK